MLGAKLCPIDHRGCQIIENSPEPLQLIPGGLASHANARLLCAPVIFSGIKPKYAEDQTMQSRSIMFLIVALFTFLALAPASSVVAQREGTNSRYSKHEYQ